MGLDMNLYKKTYVKRWEHDTPEEKYEVTVLGGGEVDENIKSERISHITEELMYWRKANAIHNYFVNECNDGVDDCKDFEVSEEQLQELLDRCEKILEASKLIKGKVSNGQSFKDGKWEDILVDGEFIEDATVANELLPTGSGFFFGSTAYDQYYYRDIEETRDMLKEALKDKSFPDYYYSASW